MKKIKVLQVCYSLKTAGIETYVLNLQRNINSNEFEVHFLVYKNSANDLFYKKEIEKLGGIVEIADSKETNYLLKHILRRINYCKILKENSFDVIHVHASCGLQGIEVFLAHLMGTKNIIIHSHSSNLARSSKFNTLKHLLHKKGLVWIKKYSKYKIACSEKAAQWLYPNQHNVKIIANGIKCSAYRFDVITRETVRTNLNLKQDTLVIGHIGSFSEIKNHSFLIDIFKNYQTINPDSVLILIGDGKLKYSIYEKVKNSGLENTVIFMGLRTDCNLLLQAMDIFVFPSYWEGMPLALLEAQASGLHCLASDTITHQVNLTNNVKFLNLTSSPSEWCTHIIKTPLSKRKNMANLLSNLGYDIETTSSEIQSIYHTLANS